MDLYILNREFEILGVIDDAESVIWTTRYVQAGDFEIYISATPQNLSLLRVGNYVKRWDDEMVGVIKTISVTTDAENGNYITASGPDLKNILASRIVWQQTILSGSVFQCISKLLTDNIISPTIQERKIANFSIAPNTISDPETIEKQVTGDNLLDVITEICETYGYGFKLTLSDSKSIVFSLYQGANRSQNQDINPRVVFSSDFDNLVNTTYSYDESNYHNVALVAGEGEGSARKTQAVGTASGLDRYELFVDSRDISSNEGEITEEEYNAQLIQQGLESLAEYQTTESYDGEVIEQYTYTYKQDYYLGDIVTAANELGIMADTRITEVIESEDAEGHKIIPTFADWGLV